MIKRTLAATLGVALTMSACGSGDARGEEPAEPPHGYVAGAEELPEAASAIAYAARGGQRLHLLDLATERQKQLDLSVPARQLTDDGRFVYAGDGDRRLEIVDAGVWTVDHADHVHFYRAPARTIGTLTFDAAVVTVAGNAAHTTVGTADGRIRVLDRRQLETGTVAEVSRIDSRSSTPLAVPYAGNLIVATGDDPARPAHRLVAMGPDGRATGAFEAPCEAPRGWVVLRGGALIACEDHLVRVKEDSGTLTATAVPSPRKPVPGTAFGHRPRSNEAALAGTGGIWSVNAPKAAVRHLAANGRDLVAAASPADAATVLALDSAGTLISYDLESGKVLAEAPLKATTLTLDVNRAYLADPEQRVVHEVDYRDGLRTARTLRTADRPDLVVEVGR
ncbi:hypothetical protein [Actinoplanes sp. DH11]|uniref:hypothetical protein n=1 Tax=Actinoplanes sp. DH11 TaxID=2857011 RepID=UPI001E284898|nr:hypothetical protein [Actinoplanes sp. DH11]